MPANVLLLFFSVAVCAAAAETVLRRVYPSPNADEVSSFEYRHSWVFNKDTFRDSDFGVKLARGTKNIVFLGDSFTVGMGAEIGERYTDLLADEFKGSYETFNLGKIATGTLVQTKILRGHLPVIRPKFVILFFYWNDIEDNLAEIRKENRAGFAAEGVQASDPFFRFLGPLKPALRKSLLYQWLSVKYRALLARLGVSKLDFRIEFDFFEKNHRSGNVLKSWQKTEHALWKLRRLCEDGSARLIVAYVPKREQLVRWDDLVRFYRADLKQVGRFVPNDRLARLCRRVGVIFIDVTRELDARNDKEAFFYKFDTHFTPAGNRKFYEAVAVKIRPFLERDLKAPATKNKNPQE